MQFSTLSVLTVFHVSVMEGFNIFPVWLISLTVAKTNPQ